MAAVKAAFQKYGQFPPNEDTAFYDLRLKTSIDHKTLRIPEFLYTITQPKAVTKTESASQTEAHFAYVAAANFARQKKLEKVATNYLKLTGGYLEARTMNAPCTKE